MRHGCRVYIYRNFSKLAKSPTSYSINKKTEISPKKHAVTCHRVKWGAGLIEFTPREAVMFEQAFKNRRTVSHHL